MCQTLSKVEMSRKTVQTSKYLGSSKASWISLTRNNSWFIVESPGLLLILALGLRE